MLTRAPGANDTVSSLSGNPCPSVECPLQALIPVARLVHDLGMLLYGGPVVAFAMLVALSGRLAGIERWEIVRTDRAWGAGLGLSMGAWVLGLLSVQYLQTGAFRWGWATPHERWTLAADLVFLALWIWNVRVEILVA